ncbi:MAG: pyridoxamine kinase [Oscillospiraceae bacterium]|nr:pyridoxamine kinase [Oscillospiraceae bacterium]MDD4414414.1 pyridoxamine kinase [Oscillospiraceae bacterium]
MSGQKRVAAIHDISCFGRCSLTVALPILSAAGIETSVIPTAVLSTHTGGFEGFTYRDLTQDIRPISKHWQSLGLEFDALYSGFLGSFEQLEIVSALFDDFKKNDNIIFVDPVMADNGKLYSVFPPEFPDGMAKLCRKADIILPNMTEAAFLLGQTYKPGPYTPDYIEAVLKELSNLGPKMVVLTGVCTENHQLGAAVYDSRTGSIGYEFSPLVDGFYHGTGDVFASALLAALLNDFDLLQSARVAVDFTVESIKRTKEAGTDVRFGVDFENSIPNLIKALNKS